MKSLLFFLCLCAVFLGGCRKAQTRLDSPQEIDAAINVKEPPYLIQPSADSLKNWYHGMQIILDHPPKDNKELQAQIEAHKPEAAAAILEVLSEIKNSATAMRKPTDKWCLLSLSCGRVKRNGEDLIFTAEVGLASLYAKRPVIAFDNMPLEFCVARLARECGIEDSQKKSYNPYINWSKTNVSPLEALESIVDAYGFTSKFTDVSFRFSLQLQDYALRQTFVESAVAGIMEKGRMLNVAHPGLIIMPKHPPKVRTEKALEDKKAESPEATPP